MFSEFSSERIFKIDQYFAKLSTLVGCLVFDSQFICNFVQNLHNFKNNMLFLRFFWCWIDLWHFQVDLTPMVLNNVDKCLRICYVVSGLNEEDRHQCVIEHWRLPAMSKKQAALWIICNEGASPGNPLVQNPEMIQDLLNACHERMFLAITSGRT